MNGTSDRRLVGWVGFVGAFSALAYTSNLSSGSTADEPQEPLYEMSFFVASLVGLAIMVGAALLVAMGARKRELFALRRPPSWWRALATSLAILVGVLVLSGIVGLFLDPGEEQGLLPETWPPPDNGVFALNALAVVVGAPVAEELLFRGVGFTLLERFGTPVAVVGTAALWGTAHGLIEAFPLIFALGIGLGVLRHQTKSVLPGIVLHGVFNAFALAAAIGTAAS